MSAREPSVNRRLTALSRSVRPLLALSGVLGGANTVLTIGQWLLVAYVVNAVFMGGKSLAAVWPQVGLIALAMAARALLAFGRDWLLGGIAIGIKNELRERLHAKLLALGPAYAAGERSGELAVTAVEGVERLEAFYARFLPQGVITAITPLLVLAVVFYLDPLAGLILALTGPLIPFFMWLVGTLAERHSRRQFLELRRLSAHFLDVLRGLPTLKLFGRSGVQADRIADVADRYRRATDDVLRVAFLSGMVLELTATIATALVAVTVGLRLVDGVIGFERALAVLLLAPEFYLPFRQLGVEHHAGMEGMATAGPIFAVLDAPEVALPTVERELPAGPQPLEVRGVSYRYPGSEHAALDGVSLVLRPGRRVAVVGESGSGKTTLVRLLARFLEPDAGEIDYGGVALAGSDLAAWRERVALVGQRPHLFHGTVRENLLIARPQASDDELREACARAGALDFIERLPLGHDTGVGEGGARLSGGERQRLAIARAFLKDAPILLLDEATSALDPESEAVVTTAVRRLEEGRATLVIAHRLSTVVAADEIIVLHAGKVVERGRHPDLLAAGGHYAALLGAASAALAVQA